MNDVAQVNGGVFKTTDYGRSWLPIFDDQPTASVGAIAVSISNPDIIYVGSGESLHRPDLSIGDGIYKSADAGKTWMHLGLRNAQQIAQLAVDPRNADRVFVAAGGFPAIPLMEDIALCKRLKRVGPPLCLSERVTTSGRRWEQHGVLRTILLMWRLRLSYFFGADPALLARRYGYGE